MYSEEKTATFKPPEPEPPPREADAGQEKEWWNELDAAACVYCGVPTRWRCNSVPMHADCDRSKQQPPPPAPAATERQDQAAAKIVESTEPWPSTVSEFYRWWDNEAGKVITKESGQLTPALFGFIAGRERQLAAGRESQWRDAAKEKPDKDGHYLAILGHRDSDRQLIVRFNAVDYGTEAGWFIGHSPVEVRFWMPLPPLPTKEGA